MLIPIIGQLLFLGYFVRINKNIIEGNKDGYPYLGSVKQNIFSGFKFLITLILITFFVSIVLIAAYSIGFIFSELVGIVFIILLSTILIFIVPFMFLLYFESEEIFSVFNFNKLNILLEKNYSSFLKTVLLDIVQKIIYLLLPAIFLFLIWHFYNVTSPTNSDVFFFISSIILEILSLLIFIPIIFCSFLTSYSLYYNELMEND
jgi:hypothetical protein